MAQTSADDVVDILIADHREMVGLLELIEETADPAEQRALTDAATAEIVRHSVAEELFVYPVYKRVISGGADEVEHDKEEHKELEETLVELEDVDAEDPDFLRLIRELKDQLNHHVDDEESDQFPKLRATVSAEELVELGRKVEAAKKVAPTRPHPDSPQSELFHMTVGLGVGMVDRLRDALTGRIENT